MKVKIAELYLQFPPVPGGWALATPRRNPQTGEQIGEYLHKFGGKPPSQVEEKEVEPPLWRDRLPPDVSEAPPGSGERIEALREFYSQNGEETPFEGGEEEDADAILSLPVEVLKYLFVGG